jgi:hypothetical protein
MQRLIRWIRWHAEEILSVTEIEERAANWNHNQILPGFLPLDCELLEMKLLFFPFVRTSYICLTNARYTANVE